MQTFQHFFESRSYQQSIQDNLDHMDTVLQDWTPVASEVLGHDERGKPSFDFQIPGGYIAAPSLYNNEKVCHLCNTPCRQKFPIKNDTKKWLLWVGSECITRFSDNKQSGAKLQQEAGWQANVALLASVHNVLTEADQLLGIQQLSKKYFGHGVKYENGKWIANRTRLLHRRFDQDDEYHAVQKQDLESRGWKPSPHRQGLYEKDETIFAPETMDGLQHAPLIIQKYTTAFVNLVKIIGGRHYEMTEPKKLTAWAQNNRQTIETWVPLFHDMLGKLKSVAPAHSGKTLAEFDNPELERLTQEYLTIPNRSKSLTKLN